MYQIPPIESVPCCTCEPGVWGFALWVGLLVGMLVTAIVITVLAVKFGRDDGGIAPPWVLIVGLSLLSLLSLPALAIDPPPGPNGLKPGVGWEPSTNTVNYYLKKGDGRKVTEIGDKSQDPWLEMLRLGFPYRSVLDTSKSAVAKAARARYGLTKPDPFGFWPLGGTANGGWAEGFWVNCASLEFFWGHPSLRPRWIALGSPDEWDGVCTPREAFDMAFYSGTRQIIQLWQEKRSGGPPPPSPPPPPPLPPPPEEPPVEPPPPVPASCEPCAAAKAKAMELAKGLIDFLMTPCSEPSTGLLDLELREAEDARKD